jgi:hypothetical protein
MSHANYLNFKAYTKVGRDPWWKAHNSLVVCSLFKSPKETPNSSRNVSKLFRRGD